MYPGNSQQQLECGQIVCVVDQFRTATVCLKWTEPTEDDKLLRPEELKKSTETVNACMFNNIGHWSMFS